MLREFRTALTVQLDQLLTGGEQTPQPQHIEYLR
jgi:hypothetical protein